MMLEHCADAQTSPCVIFCSAVRLGMNHHSGMSLSSHEQEHATASSAQAKPPADIARLAQDALSVIKSIAMSPDSERQLAVIAALPVSTLQMLSNNVENAQKYLATGTGVVTRYSALFDIAQAASGSGEAEPA